MKTRIYTLFIAAASLLVAACQTTPTETVGLESALLPKTVQFTAGAPGTRTAFTDPEGTTYPVQWTENDTEVLIWRNRSASELNAATVSPSEDRTSAKFETVFLPATGGVTYYLASPSSAVDADASIADGQWHFSVPEGQTPSEKSVDEAAQILVSKSETYETDPDSVPLHLVHWTSYGCLTLSNLDLGGEPLASVVLEAEVPWAGEWSYDPESGQSTYVGDADAGKSLFLTATDAGAVWFACAPVNMGGKTLKVTARGTKQTRIRTVTLPSSAIPEAKTFESGKIALVTIDMKDAESPESPDSKTYELVTKGGSLTEGGKFVITAAEYDVAMSTTQNEKNRGQVAVTKSDNTIVNPPDDVEVVTLESGVTSGTWAFKTRDGRYLGTIFGSNSLTTQDTKSETTDWRISYSSAGAVTIKNIETKSLSLIYNPNSHYFWAVVATVSVKSPVSLYKLKVEGDSSGKDDPKLRLVKSSLTLTEGETGSVKVGLCYSDGALSYESSDEAVVKVDSEGKLTAMKAGEATVTVTVAETEQYQSGSATCKVTVLPPVPVSGITLDKTSVSVVEGESGKLTATVNPSNAANKKVTWSSSNSSVVQVDQDGAFYALKPGTATVTVTSVADNTKKATCVVTVTKFYAVTGVTLDKPTLQLQKGATAQLTATVTPSNATNVEVIWESDNIHCATVDQNGKVTAVSDLAGTSCNIVVVARNKDRGNEHTAKCKVTIGKVPVLKAQYAMSSYSSNWSDMGSLVKLSISQEFFVRLYDTANDEVMDSGTFGYDGIGRALHMANADYDSSVPGTYFDVYGSNKWRVVLRTDGFLSTTLTCKDEAQGVDFSQDVTFYVPRPLELSLDPDYSTVMPADAEVSACIGSPVRLFIRHKTKMRFETVEPDYLTFTEGNASIAELSLNENNNVIVITPKQSGTTTWRIKYDRNGITLNRTVKIVVKPRYSIYHSSGEIADGTFTFMYDDIEDNTYTFRLYDNEKNDYVYTMSGLSAKVTSGSDRLSVSLAESGSQYSYHGLYKVFKVKATRASGWYNGSVSFYYNDELVKALPIRVNMPSYSLRYSTDASAFSSTSPVVGNSLLVSRTAPTYIRLYDETHGKYISQANDYVGSSGQLTLSTVNNMGKFTASVGNVYYPSIRVSCSDGVGVIGYFSTAVHVPCDVKWASDKFDGTLVLGYYIYLGQDHYYFLWNSTDKRIYEIDERYLTVTNTDESALYISVATTSDGHKAVRFHPVKEGITTVTLHYSDGMGATAESDLKYTFRVSKLPGS